MTLGIMQPYFYPYLGYWQLLNTVDKFVLYDNIEFTRRGWIHRNNILSNGEARMISLPLKKDSDYCLVRERKLAENMTRESTKMLNQLRSAYGKAPFFHQVFPLVEKGLNSGIVNLFEFLQFTIRNISEYLEIKTDIIKSSTVSINHNLKGEDRVLAFCQSFNANTYINSIGGLELYNKGRFEKHGVELFFLRMDQLRYNQFNSKFIPNLSIIDILMFNSKGEVLEMLEKFKLE